ncbi:DUF3846 domain-containing protein [Clavibacter sepedonicus]|uniref:DUF3846 domain-containing protein n=1 Tax=Clavibacter sepedonicus TaxID=31964 RepID=B0RJG4_CLASE|nr:MULTISPECIES: DUF3846 domain-containing protein [Clavibacter]MBD5382457.1 DUF3846 domain-containing protein [Clavibacter sp.]OQJ45294.1 hypothetical protein B5P19_15660 [Clavibacter sepedonicus]OQJ50981.1 hypothetical protein B5P20_16295 [Clavibacter sepedonicus]UUK67209.1 DUF3846 domain-containing protein [Clavibacter sepedonicus]CAQ03354.1 hypothetical protein pCSL0111 [Clavibacter sepedonicus]
MNGIRCGLDGVTDVIELDDEHLLAQLQEAVGGTIEVLEVTPACDLVIDEEGKLKGYPRNSVATALAEALDIGLAPGDYIAGPAVLIGTNPDGYLGPVPAHVMEALISVSGHLAREDAPRPSTTEER